MGLASAGPFFMSADCRKGSLFEYIIEKSPLALIPWIDRLRKKSSWKSCVIQFP